MTIECYGHIVSLSQSSERKIGCKGVAVEIQLEQDRCPQRIVLHADLVEVSSYHPGMGVRLLLCPHDYMNDGGQYAASKPAGGK